MIEIVLHTLLSLDLQLHFSMSHLPQLLLDFLFHWDESLANWLSIRIPNRRSNLGRWRNVQASIDHRAIINNGLEGRGNIKTSDTLVIPY